MKVAAIIQARMSSTRLPGKVLLDLHGEPMLARVVERARRASSVDDVVVATTTGPEDQAIEDLCIARRWAVFRGSLEDLLDRYYHAATLHKASAVVRITSDCPLIDPALIDAVVGAFRGNRHEATAGAIDYASNALEPRTFPRGLDVEVFSFTALVRAWKEDRNPAWREHVTPFMYRHPELFCLKRVANDPDLSAFRWTVDTPEDMALVRQIYGYFGNDTFSWKEILDAFGRHPQWTEINRAVEQKQL